VTDLKALAWELLHEARQSLQEQGHLAPILIAITPKENLIFDIDYEHEDDREEIYAQLVDNATDNNAVAIITVNDMELDDLQGAGPVKLEGPGWGALAQEPEESSKATEAIRIVVSGNGFETWSLTCPYFRQNSGIVFQPAREQTEAGAELELLGDWKGMTGNA
jgi:hypothetical protein